jgi:hypothetical protein
LKRSGNTMEIDNLIRLVQEAYGSCNTVKDLATKLIHDALAHGASRNNDEILQHRSEIYWYNKVQGEYCSILNSLRERRRQISNLTIDARKFDTGFAILHLCPFDILTILLWRLLFIRKWRKNRVCLKRKPLGETSRLQLRS